MVVESIEAHCEELGVKRCYARTTEWSYGVWTDSFHWLPQDETPAGGWVFKQAMIYHGSVHIKLRTDPWKAHGTVLEAEKGESRSVDNAEHSRRKLVVAAERTLNPRKRAVVYYGDEAKVE